MPYIDQDRKDELDMEFSGYGAKNPGELNYILTTIIKEYIENKPLNYQLLNDVIGAIEACKLEFSRRVVNPYEDSKIKENGDVY